MPRWLAALAGIALCAAAPSARADAPVALQRVVIDRADLEPSPMLGFARLRLYVSVVDLSQGGKVMDVYGDKAWKLKVGGSVKTVPYLAGLYDGAGANTAVVIVVEKSFEYSAELANIKATLETDILQKLPPSTQVSVIGFGSDVITSGLGPVKKASLKLASLNAEGAPGEVSLLDALTKALGQVHHITTDPEDQPVRKLVILIADGNDKYEDRAKISALGRKAQKDGVRIHAIAYTTGFKGPIRNMGELAWQSLGTIRWPRTPEAIPDAIRKAGLEIGHQYVLTFLVDPEEFVGRKLSVIAQVSASNAIESNPVKLPVAATCNKTECPTDGYCADFHCVTRAQPGGTGVVTVILIIVGALAGLFALLLGIGFALTKLKHRPRAPAPPGTGIHAVPGAPPGPATGMQAAAPAPVAPPPPAIVVGPQLYFMTGPRTGERIGLRHGFLIGKQPGCDIVLDQDGFASSQHAQILMDTAGNCTLYDKGSTNGTFVNGVRVSEYPLTHGVAIRVGSTELRFLAQ
jgi:FHA domain/von Willebrand factor type A domain